MNQLEQRVLEIIGESTDSPDVFLDTDAGMAQIRDSLNDAIQEIAMLTGSKVSKYYLPLRERQMFYRFALNYGHFGWVTDAWSINRQLRLEQTDLIRLSAHDPRWLVTNSPPRSYFQIGHDVLGVHPKPSSDTDTLELTIVEIPKAYVTDTDRINLRSDFQYAAANYAAAEYWASRGDARQATEYMGFYLDAVGLRDSVHVDARPMLSTGKEPYPVETG